MGGFRGFHRIGLHFLVATTTWLITAAALANETAPNVPVRLPSPAQPRLSAAVLSAFTPLDPAALTSLGQRLVQRFFDRLQSTGLPTGQMGYADGADKEAILAVRAILDPALIVQRADGSYETFSDYRPVDIDAFTITNLHATRPAPDLLAVRYHVATPNALIPKTGNVAASEPAPRLSLFRYEPARGEWLLVSHANFNPPIAQICSHLLPAHSQSHALPASSSASQLATASSLVRRWYQDLARDGDDLARPGGMLLPKAQLVYGDGYGRDGDSGYRTVKVGQTATRNFLVREHGNVMVIRFDALNHLQIANRAYTDRWQPRLVTLVRDSGSVQSPVWRIAGFAIFSYPRQPPDGVPCKQ